jgi:ATP-binding cassette subfamily B protein
MILRKYLIENGLNVKTCSLYLQGEISKQVEKQEEKRNSFDMLEAKNLCFNYLTTNVGVEKINFKLKKEPFTVITGRIGSGKTILV